METKLLPCPFCGEYKQKVDYTHISTGWEAASICCKKCGAQVIRDGDTQEEAKEHVIEAWNTRAERTVKLKDNGHCPDCNRLVGTGERYCAYCGAKVVE